jgi:hypothetical protein
MPPSGSSSRRNSPAPSGGHSVAALVQRAADERRLNLKYLRAKAKRVEHEDKIMKSIPSESLTFINVGYHLAMRQLQSELQREGTQLKTATKKTGREYAMHQQRAWQLSEDIEERYQFLARVHFVKDGQWCRLYTEEYKLERQKYRLNGESPPMPLHIRYNILRFMYRYLDAARLPYS